jgi:hypothetical protein
MLNLKNFILASSILLTGGTLSAHATDIFKDNFNFENGGVGVLDYSSFANWTVTNGTVDLIGNGYFDFYPGNGLYIDLDGSTDQAGTLSTTSAFNLNPGTYTLSFDLGGSQRGDTNIVDVNLGSLYSGVFTLNSSDPLTQYQETFTVTSPTSADLSFHNLGGDNVGAILDNVDLQTSSSVVPEPKTWALFGLGLIGTAGFSLRRKKTILK